MVSLPVLQARRPRWRRATSRAFAIDPSGSVRRAHGGFAQRNDASAASAALRAPREPIPGQSRNSLVRRRGSIPLRFSVAGGVWMSQETRIAPRLNLLRAATRGRFCELEGLLDPRARRRVDDSPRPHPATRGDVHRLPGRASKA